MAVPEFQYAQWGNNLGQNLVQGMQQRRELQTRNALAAALPGALSGDEAALKSLYAANPETGLKVQSYLADRGEKKAQMTREDLAALEKRLDNALLTAPDPAAIWPNLRTFALQSTASNPDLQAQLDQRLPKEYTPELIAWARGSQEPAKPEATPAEIQGYQLARSQGYPGTFFDYKKELATANTQLKIENPNQAWAPQFQILNTPQGAFAANLRNPGAPATPVMGPDGRPIIPASVDPAAQSDIYAGRAQGKVAGETAATLPGIVQGAEYAKGVIDQLLQHPGRPTITGKSAIYGGLAAKVPGTEAAGANALLNQIKGRAFLQAFESLKGGGAITEVEGQKATQAIARLETAQSDAEFVAALNELKGVIDNGVRVAQQRAGQAPQQSIPPPSPGAPVRKRYNPETGRIE